MANDSPENFMGLDGFEFVEFTGPDPQALATLFEAMGFTHVATHKLEERPSLRAGRRSTSS